MMAFRSDGGGLAQHAATGLTGALCSDATTEDIVGCCRVECMTGANQGASPSLNSLSECSLRCCVCVLQVRHIMFTWSLTQAIIDSMIDLEQAVAAAMCASPQAQAAPKPSGFCGMLNCMFGWAVPCLPLLTGRNQAVHWYQTLACALPRWLRQGRSGESTRTCTGSLR